MSTALIIVAVAASTVLALAVGFVALIREMEKADRSDLP